MKRSLLLMTGIAGVASVAVLSGTAFAATNNGNGNGFNAQLDTKAKVLSMTADQLREQLKTKTLYQIAEAKGVSEDKLHSAVATQAESRWRAAGMTDSQIKDRQKQMTERQADCDGTGSGAGQGQGGGMQGSNGNRMHAQPQE